MFYWNSCWNHIKELTLFTSIDVGNYGAGSGPGPKAKHCKKTINVNQTIDLIGLCYKDVANIVQISWRCLIFNDVNTCKKTIVFICLTNSLLKQCRTIDFIHVCRFRRLWIWSPGPVVPTIDKRKWSPLCYFLLTRVSLNSKELELFACSFVNVH